MANDLKISIVSTLDQAKSITEINRVIGQIAKDPALKTLSINIGVSDAQVSKVVQQIAQIQEKLKGLQPSDSALKIVPETAFNEFYTSVDKAIEKYSQLGQVKISQDAIDPLTGQVEKFTLSVTKGAGEVEKFKFQLASLKGVQIGGNETAFIPSVFSSMDNTQAVQANEIDKLNQAMKKAYDQGLLTEEVFHQLNTSINSAQNVKEINKVQEAFQSALQAEKNLNLQQSLISQSQSLLSSGKNVDTSGIENLITRLQSLNLSEADATRQLSLLQAEFRGFQGTATTTAEEIGVFANTLKNMSMYFGGFMIFQQVFNSIKDGISTVNDLNKSLTEISIVTYQNQQQVAALGDSYNKLAQQMGVTTQDIAQEAAELYRQGLSADQVTQRMQVITEYAKISSLDTKTASEIITSAINSMGVSAQKAADTWAYMGDATATGADEIGTAMQRVGGTAGALGKFYAQLKFLLIDLEILTFSRGRQGASVIAA